jgi:hypothetical protein
MRASHLLLGVLLLGILVPATPAQSALPITNPVDLPRLRRHVADLLETLDGLKAPLPAEDAKALRALLKPQRDEDGPDVSLSLQKILDGHCLLGVTINPESRVKVARGPRAAQLRRDDAVVVLVKVQNYAGVTQPLAVAGPQVRAGKDDKTDGKWLEVAVNGGKALGGHAVEYAILKLTARESGKREATLRFDVGQGTQDLGFRAEVPILFTVRE